MSNWILVTSVSIGGLAAIVIGAMASIDVGGWEAPRPLKRTEMVECAASGLIGGAVVTVTLAVVIGVFKAATRAIFNG